MKQQVWSSPKTMFEEFVPQVYCKNCSADDNKKWVYNFTCDAGTKSLLFPGDVYIENGKQEGLQTSGANKDDYLGRYNPCGTTHTVESTTKLTDENLNNIFPKGYYVKRSGSTTNVRVWTAGGTNVHCTTALDVNDFQLAKS